MNKQPIGRAPARTKLRHDARVVLPREAADALIAFMTVQPGSALQHLAGFEGPRSVSFVEELLKTGSGKVLKRELRAPFWAGQGVDQPFNTDRQSSP